MHPAGIRPKNEGLLVLDYGSQYTLLIARRFRELGIYAEVIDGLSQQPLAGFAAKGIILSGGPDSVTEQNARGLPDWVLSSHLPVLGICYGMQLIAEKFGGVLRSNVKREYGKAKLLLSSEPNSPFAKAFYGLPKQSVVWMSHGDDVDNLPDGFEVIGRTESGVAAAIVHRDRPIIGLQFHPEVHHTENGSQFLDQFATEICGCDRNWQIGSMLEATREGIKQVVGNGSVLVAVSGGVDSTVAAVLLADTIGSDRVHAVFVDNGLLRKNEVHLVSKTLKDLGLNLHVLHKAQEFLSALKGIVDPEQKRKIIGNTFIHCFEEYAEDHVAEFTHLGQGTLYPDVIESAGHGAGAKVIKSHHNVGGLPEHLKLELVEPFRYLFKDEVRRLGKELGVPDLLIHRHPFPGPGLGIRILGEVDAAKVAVAQEADSIFIDMLHGAGLYGSVWQAGVVLLPVKTVGVMGDNRTYQNACALRAVAATDGMTANVSHLSIEFLTQVADRIVREVDGINRVVYDVTSKPPATIEWE